MADKSPPRTYPNWTSQQVRQELSGKTKISQLLDLQALLWKTAFSELTLPAERSQVALAWERLENRLARMRMRPEPKPIDVDPRPMRLRQLRGFASARTIDVAPSAPTEAPTNDAQASEPIASTQPPPDPLK